jgi:2-polyprenyl-3-methyl-5-hydroxy-6-metoxy-1,4-benzoquinol methylase
VGILLESKRLKGFIVKKDEKILELCKGKSVLHLGCADYPFGVEQYNARRLLHAKIHDVAKTLFGIDINQDGVHFLKSIGFSDVIVGDAEKLNNLDNMGKYDVVVAGELLEHVSNVGKLFESLNSLMHNDSLLIVTTPNAHSLKNFLRVLIGRELIHPDHLYYFSPATIDHISKKYSYEIKGNYYYTGEPSGFLKKLLFAPMKLVIKHLAPFISDGLIIVLIKKG